MVDSTLVLTGQTLAYTSFAIAIILLMAWFSYKITKPGKSSVMKKSLFTALIVALTILGFSLHIATNVTIPWVSMDLNRANITPDKVFDIKVANHKFTLPQEKMSVKVGDIVVFDVVSTDLTYGFGIFRQDGTMVTQMQVVPGSRNDLMWQFAKPGIFTIRSTEYSGPKGHKMIEKDVLEVTE